MAKREKEQREGWESNCVLKKHSVFRIECYCLGLQPKPGLGSAVIRDNPVPCLGAGRDHLMAAPGRRPEDSLGLGYPGARASVNPSDHFLI